MNLPARDDRAGGMARDELAQRPEQSGAIHFHDDDIADAAGDRFAFTVPDGLTAAACRV